MTLILDTAIVAKMVSTEGESCHIWEYSIDGFEYSSPYFVVVVAQMHYLVADIYFQGLQITLDLVNVYKML